MTETPDFYRPTVDGSDAPTPELSSAPSPTATASTPQEQLVVKPRGIAIPVVVALAVGAILGGAAGAGVTYVMASNSSNPTTSALAGVVVNDPSHVSSLTAVVAKTSPSVVTISVSGGSNSGTGSGVVISSDGYVLTNSHVVTLDGASAKPTIKVQDSVGRIYSATIVGTDPTVDLAVIKLTGATGLSPIEWADSAKLNVGDAAIAMGAPLGLAGTVTTGIVSALNRSIQIASSAVPDTQSQDNSGSPLDLFNFDLGNGSQTQQAQASISIPVIQTDAAINPGNSGGALLDASGRLIGINVAIASAGSSSGSQSGSIGVGFALPSNLAKRVSEEIIKTGKASHGLLGASVSDAASVAGSKQVGALLAKITSGSAAAKAGLVAGDIVIDFNGVPISDASDLTAAVRSLPAGGQAKVTYLRGGKSNTTTVTLDALPAN